MRERLGPTSETIPAIENGLLRKEHVEYSMAWQKIIGPKNKVVYNEMGPDISTVLFFSNANEIVGLDYRFHGDYTKDYVDKYWDFIDTKAIPPAGAMGYHYGFFTPESFEVSPERLKMFKEDLEDRSRRGYWNHRAILNFGVDRLLMLELKKMGVKRESIEIKTNRNGSKTEIKFDWAYPGETTKPRKIIYLSNSFDDALSSGKIAIQNADCYYQKNSNPEDNYAVIQRLPFNLKINSKTVVAIGYQYKAHKDNDDYKRELGIALGRLFKPLSLDEKYEKLIDKLPEADPAYEENKYGMKLHVFERQKLPIKKYQIANRA